VRLAIQRCEYLQSRHQGTGRESYTKVRRVQNRGCKKELKESSLFISTMLTPKIEVQKIIMTKKKKIYDKPELYYCNTISKHHTLTNSRNVPSTGPDRFDRALIVKKKNVWEKITFKHMLVASTLVSYLSTDNHLSIFDIARHCS
jgi:hypothetical protein